mmetsp:Transcript_18229/g.40998  ORF Transcript_18229/g.40998 Transcript_18229/m.40998 type:complete len:282 (-) Transcript_18229:232-1077(-)
MFRLDVLVKSLPFLIEREAIEVADKALGLKVLVRRLFLVAQPRKRVDHNTRDDRDEDVKKDELERHVPEDPEQHVPLLPGHVREVAPEHRVDHDVPKALPAHRVEEVRKKALEHVRAVLLGVVFLERPDADHQPHVHDEEAEKKGLDHLSGVELDRVDHRLRALPRAHLEEGPQGDAGLVDNKCHKHREEEESLVPTPRRARYRLCGLPSEHGPPPALLGLLHQEHSLFLVLLPLPRVRHSQHLCPDGRGREEVPIRRVHEVIVALVVLLLFMEASRAGRF